MLTLFLYGPQDVVLGPSKNYTRKGPGPLSLNWLDPVESRSLGNFMLYFSVVYGLTKTV